ncbi:MAG: GLPGLI family protein [Flavobacteriaceae bacterium]|nr:GLPGLI family protein [Flavobacteriaceae bacterium]
MKAIFYFVLLIFVNHQSFSQNNTYVLAEYDYTNGNMDLFQKVKLFAGPKDSYSEFFNYSTKNDTQQIIEDENHIHIQKEIQDTIGEQYYLKKDEIIFRDYIFKDGELKAVIVSEKMPKFDWIFKPDTLRINKYLCNRAKLDFRGRQYNFWYTTEIPTKFGPWKFYGLPGLIVKVETDDKAIKFELTKIEFTNKNNIVVPDSGKKISFLEYANYKQKFSENLIKELRAQLPRGVSVDLNTTEERGLELNYN